MPRDFDLGDLLDTEEPPDLSPELSDACGALAMLCCPYYRGVGICDSGCQTEPQCKTCEPSDGWLAELKRAVTDIERG